MYNSNLKKQVIALRKSGKTYGEIQKAIGIKLPKSTLSDWCSGILLSRLEHEKIAEAMERGSARGRKIAWFVVRERRKIYLQSIHDRISHIPDCIRNDNNAAKASLAMLYLGEGAKNPKHGSICFGNSNPGIIGLFLFLLRVTYEIDESKLRCTVQCRADQDVESLEQFWMVVTAIPRSQFYKARIDPRTVGKPSLKLDYKGVCRIEYFSADVFHELLEIGRVMCEMGR